MTQDESLNSLDFGVIVVYFVAVLFVGIWAMVITNRSTVGGYFLAGRNITWLPIGASLFASNVGSGHFIGLAGSGAASGFAVGAFELNAMFVILLLAWVFLPVYISSKVVTMPEYLQKRFGGKRIQTCISFVYLFIYIFTKISVDLYAGAVFISQALKWNLFLCVFLLLFITGLYTIGGGLAAVIYTDTLQTLIILVGGIALTAVGFADVGGYWGLVDLYKNSTPSQLLPGNEECGAPREDAFHVFRSVSSDFPWTGVLFGMPILSVWYWCTDQVIVQRTLAARSITHAKGGVLLCSYLKVVPMFIMVMVGMISRAKYPDEVGCVVPEVCMDICQNPHSCSDIAYPKLVLGLMPQGARGLMIAVMLSALMSSLTSIFNSSSTIFTMDIWLKFRKTSTEKELMIVGRVFTLVLVAFSCLWIPIIQHEEGGMLFSYIQKISAFLQPPIAVCFVLAVFWHRTNEQGAFFGLLVGTIAGLVRMAVDFSYSDPVCGEADTRPGHLKDVHYLHFAIILAAISAAVTVVVSLATEAPDPSKLNGLTWSLRKEKLVERNTNENSILTSNDNINTYATSNNDARITTRGIINTSVTYDGNNVKFVNPISGASEDQVAENNVFSCSTGIRDRLIKLLCGFDVRGNTHNQYSNAEDVVVGQTSMEETPFWRNFTQMNLYACVLFGCSMWIVFR